MNAIYHQVLENWKWPLEYLEQGLCLQVSDTFYYIFQGRSIYVHRRILSSVFECGWGSLNMLCFLSGEPLSARELVDKYSGVGLQFKVKVADCWAKLTFVHVILLIPIVCWL